MPYKIIVVETASQSPLCFCVKLSQKLCAKKEISGGMLFFTGKDEKTGYGFAEGVCLDGENPLCQAQLSYSDDEICVIFNNKCYGEGLKKYLFLIGKASSMDKAYLYQSAVAKNYCDCLKGADRLAKRLYIDKRLIPSRLYQILSEGFEMPKESILYRCLVKTQSPVTEFDNLLLVYTQSQLKTERILRGFSHKNSDLLSRLLLYISLCEYTRLYEKTELCERMVNKEKLYRMSAQDIIEMAKDIQYSNDTFLKTVYLYTLDRTMSLCRNLQDMPAFNRLCEIKKMFF